MIINLTDVLKQDGNKLAIKGDIVLGDVSYLGESFHFVSSPTIEGNLFNNGESLILNATANFQVEVMCARCMKLIEEKLSFVLDETFVKEENNTDPDGDAIVYSGWTIDLSEVVMNAFLVNVPAKFLCKEDCKGLCQKCGTDLNKGECDCDKDVIDPRWAGLKEIMDSKKN